MVFDCSQVSPVITLSTAKQQNAWDDHEENFEVKGEYDDGDDGADHADGKNDHGDGGDDDDGC